MEEVWRIYLKLPWSLGYLHIPDSDNYDIDDIEKYPNEKITIITTGSQGEPMACIS